ncbi:hypothetical protein QC762_0000020 [Podospora pseudocomata]|uniref:Uncharacterized protein n=1 Tax=Podospora pseudocomata TaxID=2093779 RepID=A0ABR0GS55_9PEZI|nr:hypothetical protein QC762_0000020 [Podospora pseudocomata]
MSNGTEVECQSHSLNVAGFDNGGFIEGRCCQPYFDATCCLPCPMTWAYPDTFGTMSEAANWVSVVKPEIGCVFLLLFGCAAG